MCGISGVICSAPLNEADLDTLREVNAKLQHRGPDSAGFAHFGHAAIAMRRLSIVDIAGGQQPISNEDGSITVICNGEIYNHNELRSDLAARGHRFRSRSDVETIVHGYEQHGPERFLEPLRGMFALALWDNTRRRLFLARDRLGEKPIYLYRDRRSDGASRLWFASELRGILHVIPRGERRISPLAFNEFMTFQYVLEPGTPIEGVVQLPRGHVLEVSPESLDTESRPYWTMLSAGQPPNIDPVEAVREWLDIACRRMGTADVPVGVALSGGIDSSLVAAIAARHYPGQIHAFTVGYPGRPKTDERQVAARFAQALGIPFTEVEVSTSEVVNGFPDTIAAMDTPIGDIAAYGYYSVSRAARAASIPVLMSGLGGDEFFWGYEWVRDAVKQRVTGEAPRDNRTWRERLFGPRAVVRPAGQETSLYAPHAEFATGDSTSRAMLAQSGELPPDHWLKVTRPPNGCAADIAVSDTLNATWLVCNCLTLADRMSMAHSIEMRVPFLDIDLVDGVSAMRRAGLGDWAKPHKWLLLEASGHLLPDEIRHGAKQGFTPPVGEWIRQILARWRYSWEEESILSRVGLASQQAVRDITPSLTLTQLYKMTVFETWARAALGEPLA